MTTTVTIQPANHKVRLTKLFKPENGAPPMAEEEVLEPNTAARTFHVHTNMDLLVAEDTGQPKVPVMSGASFEDDLMSVEGEHGKNGGITPDEMISAYELRLYALREQKRNAEADFDTEV